MARDAIAIIPTYNEKENIVQLIDEINALGVPIDILVVDDNSPDGTGHIVESAKKTRPNLDIMHREKKVGIGPAYIEGFRLALKNKHNYKYFVQMDADFSHAPGDIPRFLETVCSHDVVIGSRYIKKGSVSEKWHPFRKFLSRFGNLYARFITGLRANDCTSGFRCTRREALVSIDFEKGFLNGYGFLIQMLYEMKKYNADICEIPIFFNERMGGKSKMNLSIMVEACFSLILLRLRDMFLHFTQYKKKKRYAS